MSGPGEREALVERERELELLEGAVAAAQDGRGALVSIEGAPGLGKTRLLDAVSSFARNAGLSVLRARGAALERDYPGAVIASLLRPALVEPAAESALNGTPGPVLGLLRLNAEPTESLEPSGALLDAIFRLVEALVGDRPTALCVDDGHWVDELSLRAIAYLAHRAADLPVLLVLASRPVEGNDDALEARSEAQRALLSAADRRLDLAALSQAGTGALAARHGEAVRSAVDSEALHALTRGNPLIIGHFADGLRGAPPSSADTTAEAVGYVVAQRLAAAAPAARRVAEAVAVLGDGAPAARIAALAELSVPDVLAAASELERLGLFSAAEPLRFSHALVLEGVLEGLGTNAAGRAHLRAAEVLRAAHADPSQIAVHLLRSPPTGNPQAVLDLRAAAAQARGRASPTTAVLLLRRALCEQGPVGALPELGVELGRAELAAGDPQSALNRLRPAVKDPGWPARVVLEASLGQAQAQDLPAAVETLLSGARAREDQSPDDALLLRGAAAYVCWFLPAAIRPPIVLPDPDTLSGQSTGERMALVGHVSHSIGVDGRAERTAALSRRALSDGGLVQDPALADYVNSPLLGLLYAEQLPEAERHLELLERSASDHIWPGALLASRLPRVYLLTLRGDTSGVIAETDALLAQGNFLQGPLVGWIHGYAMAMQLLATLVREGADAAGKLLSTLGLAGELPPEALFVGGARAQVYLAQGRPGAALADARIWRAINELVGDPLVPIEMHTAEALALIAHGEPEAGRERAAADLARARHWGAPGRIAGHLRVAAQAEPDGAINLLKEADDLLTGSALRLERARVLLDLGVALRRAGKRTEARTALQRAVQAAAECQAQALVDPALEELRVLGARPRRLAFSGADALTASERRVAELAAAGATNREIGQRLFVTVKTVDSHLMRAYRKLGISSRNELARSLAA